MSCAAVRDGSFSEQAHAQRPSYDPHTPVLEADDKARPGISARLASALHSHGSRCIEKDGSLIGILPLGPSHPIMDPPFTC